MEVHKEIYTNLFVYQSFHLNEKKKEYKKCQNILVYIQFY
jgi:hypothetical protein